LIESLIEAAKLAAALAIALMSMTIVTYALAVPRLQSALSSLSKSTTERKKELEKRMKEASITLKEIEVELKGIEKEGEEIGKMIDRLSWKGVIPFPMFFSVLALCILTLALVWSSQFDALIVLVALLSVTASLLHLLFSLRWIERAATRTG